MLIIGFDVFHSKQNKNRSFDALVASIYDDQTVYYSYVTKHVGGEELSNFFTANMTSKMLLNFYLLLKNLNYRIYFITIVFL
jgi:aubergine-like protein